MSDSAERRHRSNCTQPLRRRIAHLEAELRAMRRQNETQRQRLAYKYGQEFLTLIDGDPNTGVTVTDTVQKLVCQDEEGNPVSETNASLVGQVIQVRFKSLH